MLAPGARLTGASATGGRLTLQGTSQASAFLSGVASLAQEVAFKELGRRLTMDEFATLVCRTGDTITDGDNENDNVTNTGLVFPRVNVETLACEILRLKNDAPVVAPATFSLAENSAVGTTVGTVVAADPDPQTTLMYALAAGNESGAFAINQRTGQITVANSAVLNFEVTPQFVLTVEAMDDGVPALSGSATITITLTNVNEAPAVQTATFAVAENSPNGKTVGHVTATDPDAATTLTFAITGGNTKGAFTIDPVTGILTVANRKAINFEVKPTFHLTVQVTDDGTPVLSGTETITVKLVDVHERFHREDRGEFPGLWFQGAIVAQQAWVLNFVADAVDSNELVITLGGVGRD
jgi:VCBS repeat-containing protein